MNRRNILLSAAAIATLAVPVGAWLLWPSLKAPAPATPAAPTTPPTQSAGPAPAAGKASLEVTGTDRVLGAPEAPVTIIEYASLTCPHCASFHRLTLPQVKAEWIETGKARFVYRHFPLDGVALRAAAIANCLESDKAFFGFLDVLFDNQDKWATAQDPLTELAKYARFAGLGEERFQSCATDDAAMQAILAARQGASADFGIGSTPSFLINGTLLSGTQTYEDFAKVLAKAAGES